ncbi:phage structural protein [Desulfovibrio cuneatus]|uniref:phage structural protein n=1 Tax=Desulfovibrio cuneatus TaxID=159728 RepID=UPI00040D6C29|nr:phage protein [Desulfovibrio cuneatus]
MEVTYSFLDVEATIVGPGGSFQLGNGAGVASEGISITATGDKNTMSVGADGSFMHSLKADRSGSVTVTLLKTSEANAKLQNMFNFQTKSGKTHGKNTIVIRNIATGDVFTCEGCAFSKQPENKFGNEAASLGWAFHCGKVDAKLGTGLVY